MTSAMLTAPPEGLVPPEPLVASPKLDSQRTYSCPECRHVLRVFGLGRHRVYFELTAELLDDPVMDRVCPECGRGLPGKNTP
jgi:hypothetical protein